MSVLIKKMKMPKNCWLCHLSVFYEKPREMLMCSVIKEEVLRNKIDGNCPLVEIPPHGRLIDADALEAQCDDPYWCVWLTDIKDAPTIIESTIGQLNSDSAVNEAEEGE